MEGRPWRGRRGATPRSHTLALFLVLLCAAAPPSRALRFELQSGHPKCISEDINLHALSVGKYSIVNPSDFLSLPESHNVTVRVVSPKGNSLHYAVEVGSGNFAFTSSEAGDHLACFWTREQKPPVTMVVEFEWRTGVAAKAWTNVVKKGQIDAVELELKKFDDLVTSIHDEVFYLREREYEMQMMNISTNSRMAWLSFLSLLVCLSVAGLQLWHLRAFFKKKKLL